MSASARRVYRHAWVKIMGWIAAGMWALSAVLNFVWFGELSVISLVLPVLWGLLAILYSRPYAVIEGQSITLAVAPIRPTTLAWDEIVSYEEPKPGIGKLTLSSGKKLTVRVKDVRLDDQSVLREVLRSRRPDWADATIAG